MMEVHKSQPPIVFQPRMVDTYCRLTFLKFFILSIINKLTLNVQGLNHLNRL